MWIDVEDEAALVDGIDVEDFPTILIGSARGPRFFGALTPQPEVLMRLVRAHVDSDDGHVLGDAVLAAVLQRIRAR